MYKLPLYFLLLIFNNFFFLPIIENPIYIWSSLILYVWPPINIEKSPKNNFKLLSGDQKHNKLGFQRTYNKNLQSLPFYLPYYVHEKNFILNWNKPKSERDILDLYFSTFFSSWLNYNNSKNNKKFIIGHIPRFFEDNIVYRNKIYNCNEYNSKKFFSTYPNGYILSIIRNPSNWICSARLSSSTKFMKNDHERFTYWKNSIVSMISLYDKYKGRVIFINFDDLIINTELIMKKICNIIGIKFEEILTKPSFNLFPVLSNSSFGSKEPGIIDKNTIKRHDDNTPKEIVEFYKKTSKYWIKF